MKRKINGLLVLCIVIVSVLSITAFAYSNTAKVADDEVINTIKLLEIANGDEFGNMNYDKEVTRAEFIKMVINASPYKETAANIKLNVSLFPDVKNSYWGAGYISVAISNGLVNGYVDGTFKPNNTVTLEEAATIIIRLLGYTNDNLIGSYPTAQLQKYESLELDKNIGASRGDKLTREQCMILLYNALSAKTKNSSVYCTLLGFSINSEGKLDFSSLLEDKLDGPILVSDVNDIFKNTDFKESTETVYVLNNNITDKSKISKNDVVYYSDVIDTVYIYRKTATGIVENTSSSTVRISGKEYSLATTDAKNKLSFGGEYSEEKSFVTLILGINDTVVDVISGDIAKISENDSNSSLISMIDATISKAIYISNTDEASNWESKIPFDIRSCELYFNGKKTDSANIKEHDVIYYSKAFNSIWIYRKTVSGTIETISTPTSPSQLTVSGRTYKIVSSQAAYDLSVYGGYEVGDRVTLVLGINDECIAIVEPGVVSGSVYGVVTQIGEKTYTDKNNNKYTAKFTAVTDTLNNTHVYEFYNKSLSVGDAVKVTIGGNIVISKLVSSIGKSNAALISIAFKEGLFTQDCEIIEYHNGSTSKVNSAKLTGILFEPELILNSNYVLYVEFDSDNYIKRLILNNYTGDHDDYGVVTDVTDKSVTCLVNGEKKSFPASESQLKKVPVRITTVNNTTNVRPLINKLDDIISFDGNIAYDSKGFNYPLADNIGYYIKTPSGYEASNIDDMLDMDYSYTVYFDKDYRYGGQIRIIVANRKV